MPHRTSDRQMTTDHFEFELLEAIWRSQLTSSAALELPLLSRHPYQMQIVLAFLRWHQFRRLLHLP